jgi:hypothetical protein
VCVCVCVRVCVRCVIGEGRRGSAAQIKTKNGSVNEDNGRQLLLTSDALRSSSSMSVFLPCPAALLRSRSVLSISARAAVSCEYQCYHTVERKKDRGSEGGDQ